MNESKFLASDISRFNLASSFWDWSVEFTKCVLARFKILLVHSFPSLMQHNLSFILKRH
jgi:hypothetical protein